MFARLRRRKVSYRAFNLFKTAPRPVKEYFSGYWGCELVEPQVYLRVFSIYSSVAQFLERKISLACQSYTVENGKGPEVRWR